MTTVIFKVTGAGTYAEIVRSKLPSASLVNGVVQLQSHAGAQASLNDHLVWLWGMLKHQRRTLKTAVGSGARIICECKVPKGQVHLKPNGAEMLHLLGAELILEAK